MVRRQSPSGVATIVGRVSEGAADRGVGGLPDFDRPPVTEVALGVQFNTLPVRAIDLGPLRQRWFADYPIVQEQPPLEPAMEDGPRAMPVIVFGPAPMMRHWFMSEDQTHLLQVQQDRLILNWRRMSDDAEYPRYPVLRAVLEHRLAEFSEYVDGAHLQLRVTQAEVTYINDLGRDGDLPPRLDEVARVWASNPGHHLGEPSEVRFAAAYPVPDAPGPARLLVSLDPQRRADGTPTVLLTLTLRGKPGGDTTQDALEFLDLGRAHVVRSFTELTAETMHERWGRR